MAAVHPRLQQVPGLDTSVAARNSFRQEPAASSPSPVSPISPVRPIAERQDDPHRRQSHAQSQSSSPKKLKKHANVLSFLANKDSQSRAPVATSKWDGVSPPSQEKEREKRRISHERKDSLWTAIVRRPSTSAHRISTGSSKSPSSPKHVAAVSSQDKTAQRALSPKLDTAALPVIAPLTPLTDDLFSSPPTLLGPTRSLSDGNVALHRAAASPTSGYFAPSPERELNLQETNGIEHFISTALSSAPPTTAVLKPRSSVDYDDEDLYARSEVSPKPHDSPMQTMATEERSDDVAAIPTTEDEHPAALDKPLPPRPANHTHTRSLSTNTPYVSPARVSEQYIRALHSSHSRSHSHTSSTSSSGSRSITPPTLTPRIDPTSPPAFVNPRQVPAHPRHSRDTSAATMHSFTSQPRTHGRHISTDTTDSHAISLAFGDQSPIIEQAVEVQVTPAAGPDALPPLHLPPRAATYHIVRTRARSPTSPHAKNFSKPFVGPATQCPSDEDSSFPTRDHRPDCACRRSTEPNTRVKAAESQPPAVETTPKPEDNVKDLTAPSADASSTERSSSSTEEYSPEDYAMSIGFWETATNNNTSTLNRGSRVFSDPGHVSVSSASSAPDDGNDDNNNINKSCGDDSGEEVKDAPPVMAAVLFSSRLEGPFDPNTYVW